MLGPEPSICRSTLNMASSQLMHYQSLSCTYSLILCLHQPCPVKRKGILGNHCCNLSQPKALECLHFNIWPVVCYCSVLCVQMNLSGRQNSSKIIFDRCPPELTQACIAQFQNSFRSVALTVVWSALCECEREG